MPDLYRNSGAPIGIRALDRFGVQEGHGIRMFRFSERGKCGAQRCAVFFTIEFFSITAADQHHAATVRGSGWLHE